MKPHILALLVLILMCCCSGLNAQDNSKIDSLQQVIIQHQKIDSLEREINQLKYPTVIHKDKHPPSVRDRQKSIGGLVLGILMIAGGTTLLFSSNGDDILDELILKPFAIINGTGLLIGGIITTAANGTRLAKLKKARNASLGVGVGQYGIGMVVAFN